MCDMEAFGLVGGLICGDLIGSAFEGMVGSDGRAFVTCESRLTDDSRMAVATLGVLLSLPLAQIRESDFTEAYSKIILEDRHRSVGYSPDMVMWANGEINGGMMEGNGAGIRAATIALAVNDFPAVRRLVSASVRITHSEEAAGMAHILADAIVAVRAGSDVSSVLTSVAEVLPLTALYSKDIYKAQAMDTTLWWTLPAAIHIGLTASNYTSLFAEVLEIGGDTDSIGAMAGAIGHARWGLNGMPKLVRERLGVM